MLAVAPEVCRPFDLLRLHGRHGGLAPLELVPIRVVETGFLRDPATVPGRFYLRLNVEDLRSVALPIPSQNKSEALRPPPVHRRR